MFKTLRKILTWIVINIAMIGLVIESPVFSDRLSIAKAEETAFDPVMLISELFRSRVGKIAYEKLEQRNFDRESAEVPGTKEMAKNKDANVVLVVGDKLANGLHLGLKSAFADTPGIIVKGFGFENFGLTQSMKPTWITLLTDKIRELEPDLVVLMFGTRDRRNIEETGGRIKFMTRAWENNYRFKVAQIATEVLKLDCSLIWVGLAPTDSESRSNDFKKFNAIYKSETVMVGGQFLDIWHHFLGDNGKYENLGTNIFGMESLLRGSQGIYFTKDGYRKLAYFVKNKIINAIGIEQISVEKNSSDNPGYMLLTGVNQPQIRETNSQISSVTNYRDSLQYRLMVLGETLPRVEGRADDYTWNPTK